LINPRKSTLALFVARVHLADDKPFAFALDDAAMLASFFDR